MKQVPKLFESRAQLEAEIHKLQKIMDAANGCYEPDVIERASKAEKRQRELLPLFDSEEYRPLLELQSEAEELKRQINNAASFEEKQRPAERLKKLEIRIQKEMRDERLINAAPDDKEIVQGRKAVVQTLISTCPREIERIPLAYIKSITDNWKNKVGSGGFGNVYKGVDTSACITVAVKALKSDVMDEGEKEQFENEVKTLSRLNHPNIIRLLGYYSSDDKHCMVLEFAAGGSVHSILQMEHSRRSFSPTARLYVAEALVAALDYLHRQEIHHRDVKPENMCLWEGWDENPKMVLIDFGVAHKIVKANALQTQTSNPGTVMYMANEYLNYPFKFSDKSEVFSVGIVLMVLLTGAVSLPFNHRECSEDTLLEQVDGSAGDWPHDSHMKLASIAVKCASTDPDARPRISSLRHRLKGIRTNAESAVCPKHESIVTSYQSRSRPSRLQTPTTKLCCMTCGRSTTQGIACVNNHFICYKSTCVEEMVREQLGNEKFRCRAEGCRSSFLPEDLYGKISPRFYGELISTMNKGDINVNAIRALQTSLEEMRRDMIDGFSQVQDEVQSTKEKIVAEIAIVKRDGSELWTMSNLQEEISKLVNATAKFDREESVLLNRMERLLEQQKRGLVDSIAADQEKLLQELENLSLQHASGVAMLASGRLQCPRLFVLWPVRSRRGLLSRIAIAEEYRLYFLCAHDKSLVETTIRIKEPRKWLQKAAPLIKFAIFSLRVMATVYGIPIPALPDFIPGSNLEQQLARVIQQMSVLLTSDEIYDLEEWVQRCGSASELLPYMEEREREIPPEAHAALVAKAYKPKNIGWMKEMEIVSKGDIFAWVKKENVEAWKQT